MRVRLPNNLAAIVLLMVSWFLVQGLGPLRAQTTFGVIVGVVTDASEAAVPNVSLTVTNTAMGIARQLKTNQVGQYRVESLLPGIYSVRAEIAGFQVTEVTGVEVPVSRTVTVNIVMQVGAVTQKVEVTGVAPLLDTATAAVGAVINNRSVTTIPLNGRSFTDLVGLVPGAVNRGGAIFAVAGGHNYSVSGVAPDQNNFTIDGVNANEEFFKHFGIQPSIDAIQEFKVQTHTTAEYGFGAGANVNVAIKSGTNQLHGALFEFLRNDKLDAVNWFTNATSPAGKAVRPGYHQNQWGFVVGGPVYIPKVYNGRDKFFWLVNYEGFKIRSPSVQHAVIPTTAQLGGNFVGDAPIYDPETTRQVGTSNGVPIYARDQFSYNGVLNVIDPNRLNDAMVAYANMFYPASTTRDLWTTNPLRLDQYQINVRADYKFNDKLNFFARVSTSNVAQTAPASLPTYSGLTVQKFRNAVLSWTYLPSSTTVVDIKAGVNRSNVFTLDSSPAPGAVAFYAAHPIRGLMPGNAQYPLVWGNNISSFTGTSQGGVPLPTTDIQGHFNVAKIRGRHTFKAGMTYDNFRSMQDNFGVNTFEFTEVPTNDPQHAAATGYSVASFLLGLPSSGRRNLGNTTVYMRWGQYQFYLQDDIRVTRRLTLNLGLRYEWDQLPRDRDNRLSQFDTTTGTYIWAGDNAMTGQGPNARRTIRDPDFNNFAPRIGFAYQINPKTTLRGGYGIFYATNYLWEMQGVRGQWPYALAEVFAGQNVVWPDKPVETWFEAYTDVVPGAKPGSQHVNNRLSRTSYTQQWNMGVQRELARDMMLEVSYVATKGTKMPLFWNANVALPGPGLVDPRRRWPDAGNFVEGINATSSNYHSLQAKVEKRFSNGLQFLASYAWAHAIDMAGSGVLDNWGGTQDPYNWAADRGNGNVDRRHILSLSYVYQLPFGRGRRYLSSPSGIVNQVLGGWEATGITHFNSGAPYTVGLGMDWANNGGGGAQRPDRVPGQPTQLSPDPSNKRVGYLNAGAFALPEQYTYGNLGRNTLFSPGFSNWDIGLFKSFPLHGEGKVLQFRAEFFNAFNNVSMGGPDSRWCEAAPGAPALGQPGSCNPNFGQVFGTQSASRQIQFGLKLLF